MNVAETMKDFNISELSLVLETLTGELTRRTSSVQDILQVIDTDNALNCFSMRQEVQRTLRTYNPENTYFSKEDFFNTEEIRKLTLNALNCFIEGVTKEISKRLESYRLLQDHLYGEDLTKKKNEWISPYGEEFDQSMQDWQENPQYKYNTLREC